MLSTGRHVRVFLAQITRGNANFNPPPMPHRRLHYTPESRTTHQKVACTSVHQLDNVTLFGLSGCLISVAVARLGDPAPLALSFRTSRQTSLPAIPQSLIAQPRLDDPYCNARASENDRFAQSLSRPLLNRLAPQRGTTAQQRHTLRAYQVPKKCEPFLFTTCRVFSYLKPHRVPGAHKAFDCTAPDGGRCDSRTMMFKSPRR